jgi:hypothetical protein
MHTGYPTNPPDVQGVAANREAADVFAAHIT